MIYFPNLRKHIPLTEKVNIRSPAQEMTEEMVLSFNRDVIKKSLQSVKVFNDHALTPCFARYNLSYICVATVSRQATSGLLLSIYIF